MTAHRQVWVKVNAQVDSGIADLVSAISNVEGLQTVQSCEGILGESDAYIYFWCGPSDLTSHILFSHFAPALQSRDIQCTGKVEVFNGSMPTAKLAFSAESLADATAALKAAVPSASDCAHSYECSRGKECTRLAC